MPNEIPVNEWLCCYHVWEGVKPDKNDPECPFYMAYMNEQGQWFTEFKEAGEGYIHTQIDPPKGWSRLDFNN